jgi:hypothetical protein
LTTTKGLHEFPAWAPDGKRVACSREVNGFKKIFVNPLLGDPVQLTVGNPQVGDIWAIENFESPSIRTL